MQDKDTEIMAGNLAYNIILAMFPVIALLTAFISSININMIRDSVILPKAVANVLIASSNKAVGSVNIIVYILASFLALKAAFSMMVISNKLYGNTKRLPYYKVLLKAIFIMIFIIFTFIILTILPLLGNFILDAIFIKGIKVGTANLIAKIYQLINIPVTIIILYYIISLLYRIVPNNKLTSKDVFKGALFTTVTLVLFTKIYSYYLLINSANTSFYGSMSNVITTMIWAYFISLIFIIGMKLNIFKD